MNLRDFPPFMKNKLNMLSSESNDKGIEGYLFEGLDGSQIIYWSCHEDGISREDTHDFDEWFIVISGQYTHIQDDVKTPVGPGEEYYIKKGTTHSGEFIAGTRTIHCFGGRREKRVLKDEI